jgi:hypothetical protein
MTTLDIDSAIRSRAYEYWKAEGEPSGRDLDYWLKAEAEITAVTAPAKTPAQAKSPAPSLAQSPAKSASKSAAKSPAKGVAQSPTKSASKSPARKPAARAKTKA